MPTRLLQALKNRWQELSVQRRGAIVFAIPLLCIMTAVGTDSLYDLSVRNAEKQVVHSQRILLESQNLLNALINAETGVRGYYLTRHIEFLEPYNLALKDVDPSLDLLRKLVQDNPKEVQQINILKQLVQVRASQFQAGVQIVNDSNTYSFLKLYPILVQGKQTMDRLRAEIARFQSDEARSLEIFKQSLIKQQYLNLVVNWCSVFISIIGTALAMGLFNNLLQELRKRELYLQRSRNLTEAIAGNVVDGVVILNLRYQIQSINDAAVKMFGYTSDEATGQDWKNLLAETADLSEETIASLLEGSDRGAFPIQSMGRRKSGESFPIEVSFSNLSFDNRRIAIVRDVTERQQAAANLEDRARQLVQLNANLEKANLVLEERNRDLDQFAYVASHDLKAPLRAISNLSEWIEEDIAGQITSETQKQMQLLRERVLRLDKLLDGLLHYSRAGRTPTQIESVKVGALLAEIVETLNPPSTFKIEISPDMPVLEARELLLKQVFTNLIDNAIKHHPGESGLVQVSVSDRGDRYEFTVADDGKGIDPKFHNKIFEIFQTLQPRDTHESTGIGLAIVKKIVETEGGTIHLESQVNKGATFRFTWLKSTIG